MVFWSKASQKAGQRVKLCSGGARLEICRDRWDRRSCKIFPNCVTFWGNNANLLGNYREIYALNAIYDFLLRFWSWLRFRKKKWFLRVAGFILNRMIWNIRIDRVRLVLDSAFFLNLPTTTFTIFQTLQNFRTKNRTHHDHFHFLFLDIDIRWGNCQ